MPGWRGLWWLHTHTHILTFSHASSIRLITQEKVEPTFHQRLIVQQEQRDTSACIYKKRKNRKQIKKDDTCVKAAHSCPFQTEQSRGAGCDILLLESHRAVQDCCQIQQLNSVHDDAAGRKCLALLCKHRGSLENFAQFFPHRWWSKTIKRLGLQTGFFQVNGSEII